MKAKNDMAATEPDRIVEANKQHVCDLCGLRIRKGATYVLREGVFGSIHWRFRMHPVCKSKTASWHWTDWEEWRPGDEYEFRRYNLEMIPGVITRWWLSRKVEAIGGGP